MGSQQQPRHSFLTCLSLACLDQPYQNEWRTNRSPDQSTQPFHFGHVSSGSTWHGQAYQNFSLAMVRKAHPSWNETQVLQTAKRDFEQAANEYFVETLKVCRKLRPNAKWGFYGLPWNALYPCATVNGTMRCLLSPISFFLVSRPFFTCPALASVSEPVFSCGFPQMRIRRSERGAVPVL